MSYEPPRPVRGLLLTPEDREAPARLHRLRRLGLVDRPAPTLDVFAGDLAQLTSAPYAMVNFIGEDHQFFAGLSAPAVVPVLREDGSRPVLGRVLPRDHGFCPHVVVRRKALVLEDVRDYPRFAGNPVVDEYGMHSYLGAPLIDSSGMALGTVCAADTAPRAWGRTGLETIKALAADLVVRLERSAADGLPP
ncbi:GAF domain-containing protein [Streptomyces pluripotens]|uniref:GAF domain-containing protein n=1 Tax=Streptomyces pluripotens TaxID=1355015 RepID=A0A221P5Z4_9ACTN|nr:MULTISPECIES: GAF domain-containing protein [Streptomyces]ARP73295.1 histidine kinase [Streptomyces pluripotens]ASN27544.1 GAF domain-containing protein [Streptomyces pluripotens]KIE23284.1 histidine kinase [Streptomyces sp. MUSC 125]MCH0560832.1 GAF domain-containing protein [Streptomyces sp. MUM 16J]